MRVYEANTRVNYFFVDNLSIIQRFANVNTESQLLMLVITFCSLTFLEPITAEIAKACCFKKPRRGQKVAGTIVRTYSIEKIQKSNPPDRFSYEMMNSSKYRRALLLLNQQDIDEADDEDEKDEDDD